MVSLLTKADLAKVNLSSETAEHKIRCPKHGTMNFAYFAMPKPYSCVVARYVCALCVDELQGDR
jgi:hypothetical protein